MEITLLITNKIKRAIIHIFGNLQQIDIILLMQKKKQKR